MNREFEVQKSKDYASDFGYKLLFYVGAFVIIVAFLVVILQGLDEANESVNKAMNIYSKFR